tara:strand:- start:1952 stop:2983 length:1032 start_codon:yes stop_codon:yes gene_type:complete
MKVGHFVSLGLGGADKCAVNIVRGLCELGEEPLVFYNEFSIPRSVAGNHDDGYTPPSRISQYEGLVELIQIDSVSDFRDYGLDILHTHRSGEDAWLLPGLELQNFPFKIVETNFHGGMHTKADVRVSPSKSLLSRLGPATRIIPNAINPPRVDSSLKESLGLQGKFVYGRIARPDRDIYCKTNLEAYSQIETDETSFLYIAPYSQARADAKELGIKNIIFIEPTVDDFKVSQFYNTFDLLCHSNRIGETFGNTIAEAMIHGTPVVSHFGSPSWPQAHVDLFGDRAELVVESGATSKYSELMNRFREPEYHKSVSSYLQERAKRLYDYRVVASQYLDLYREILQ